MLLRRCPGGRFVRIQPTWKGSAAEPSELPTTGVRPEAETRSETPPGVGLLFGLALLATLVAFDVVLDDESANLVAAYVAVPFITAFLAGPLITGAVGLAALGAAIASPEWNMNEIGDPDWVVRCVIISLGTVLAVASAWVRQRGESRAERLHQLDALGAVADGSLPLAETLRRVTDVIVPAVADICMVDAVHDGRATRIATRASGHPDAEAIQERMRHRESSAPKWLVDVQRPWRRVPRWLPRMGEEDLRRLSHGTEDLEFLRSLGIRSSVSVPITARDRNLGVLTLVTAWSGRRYGIDDVRFAQILAGRMGLALDNAGLFSDLESIERRMDTVMSIVDEAVVIHGAGGELIFANPAAARMLGFESSEQAVDAPTARIDERFLVRDENGREVGAEALAGRQALTGVPVDLQTLRVIDRASGRERWARTKAQPIHGAAGELLYTVTVIEDVTDVKRAEFAQRLLARTGELVSHSDDYMRTLEEVPALLVPDFADGCSVNLARDDGLIEQVAVAHPNLDQARLARELREREPIRVDDESSMAQVLRTGQPVLVRLRRPRPRPRQRVRAPAHVPRGRRDLADRRPDAGRRPHGRRAHLRQPGGLEAVRRGRPRARARARAPRRARARERPARRGADPGRRRASARAAAAEPAHDPGLGGGDDVRAGRRGERGRR